MLELKYIEPNAEEVGNEEIYLVEFKSDGNIVELKGDFPIKTTGFTLSRIGQNDNWDYSTYTTIYREIEGGVQFSNDGSVYVEPEPIPQPEPHVPTLEEIKELKLMEMHSAKEIVISQGFNAILTDGTTEHFDLKGDNMTYLTALQTQVLAGANPIPWHVSDENIPCKFYSNEDMGIITTAAMNIAAYHITYLKDLTRYINSIESMEEVNAVYYGMGIPSEYQSEPLKVMVLAQMQTEVENETNT